MLSFSSSRRIFLARSATDMRRGIDTLASMVMGELGSDPRSGDCFVFVGRDRRRLVEGTGVGRGRLLAVCQASGRRHLRVAHRR
ncbi:MAG: IS66 family insertion sequence element accessory protein TnpB [Planctomycetes bacterium]|nr:IS66 family insertion sequence element accessory protein TnpB [Planctomycetota bacterium]